MKFFSICLIIVFCSTSAFAQGLTPQWTVASFTDPCTETNQYRYIYPGPVEFDTDGNLMWLMRDRSTCRQPYNNFTMLKVKPDGTPLLADFKKYTTFSDAGTYYTEVITVHGNRGYWVGSSYAQDSLKSLFITAVDLKTSAIIWTKRWKPVGATSYTPVGLTATDNAVYLTANASVSSGEPVYLTSYAMILGKLDLDGNQSWNNTYLQPFYQYYRGNIIVTDSLIYTCALKYSDAVPYDRGQGNIAAFRVSDGGLENEFYFAKKRQLSEYDPTLLTTDGKQIVACGTNPAAADAAIFAASFSLHLDSLAMLVYSTKTTYGGLMAAAMSESGILYTISTEYEGATYKTGLNVFDCKSGIRTLHRNLEFTPVPALNGVYMAAKDASVYISMTTYSSDTTLAAFNRYDANLVKFDASPLGVGEYNRSSVHEIGIYPHPVSTHATFIFGRDIDNGELQIIDALGRTVRNYKSLRGTEFLFERENLPAGIYFYRLEEYGNILGTGKMVVE